jgi:crossover junction endodeoxyribonuclease RusA
VTDAAELFSADWATHAALRTSTVLVVPPCKWMNSNERYSHWSQRSGPTKEWREATAEAARDNGVPAMERATITAVVRRADRRTDTDAQNRYPTIKAAVDGLVDARVLPDDKDAHVLALTIRPGPPVSRKDFPRGVLELIITEEA